MVAGFGVRPIQAFIVQRIGRKIADLEIQVRFLVEAHSRRN